jgi:sigma-B regulation protein RsbU (phosphoserine phosphatase)
MRRDGTCERLSDGGISLGMFEQSTYATGHVVIQTDDLVAVYSDGITEAENPAEIPFDEIGLETALKACRHKTSLSTIGADVVQAVERHTAEKRFADDLTILLLRRTTPAPVGV